MLAKRQSSNNSRPGSVYYADHVEDESDIEDETPAIGQD